MLPLLLALAVPLAARLLQAAWDIRRSRQLADVDLHFLPQSLAPLVCAALAVLLALIIYPLILLMPLDLDAQARWFGYATASVYLLTCFALALVWRRRLAQPEATLAAFAAEPLARHEQRLHLLHRW